jgi:hypothetical protein
MVSKIAANDRGAKCDDAAMGALHPALLSNAGLNKNINLIIYLYGPKYLDCACEFRVPDGRELAASTRTQQPSWLVNHD